MRRFGNSEILEVRVVEKNEALCRDQILKSSTGVTAGIDPGGKSRRTEDHCDEDKSNPFDRYSPHLVPLGFGKQRGSVLTVKGRRTALPHSRGLRRSIAKINRLWASPVFTIA